MNTKQIVLSLLLVDFLALTAWAVAEVGYFNIFAGILANLRIHFQQTSLFNTLVMLTLLVGGLGLIARSLRPVGR